MKPPTAQAPHPQRDGESDAGKEHDSPRIGGLADVSVRPFPDDGLPFLDTDEREKNPPGTRACTKKIFKRQSHQADEKDSKSFILLSNENL